MPTSYLKDIAAAGLQHWDAEPFLKKVTDIVPSIIYIFNHSTQSNEYSNRSLGQALGYSSKEILDVGAMLMPKLCHPEDLNRVIDYLAEILALNDGEVIQLEYRMQHKNGDWIWLLAHDTVFDRDENGQVLRHIGVAADISAQKNAENHAIAEGLLAKATNDELRAFSYSISHDMKAPANTLNLVLTELLESHQAVLDEDATALLNLALTTVGRMHGLLDNVLNYTNVISDESGKNAISLQDILADVIVSLEDDIKESGARIDIGNLPTIVAAPRQIFQMFRHLIDNAIRFRMPNRKPHIVISAENVVSEHDISQISVSDNGIGISSDNHEHIFTLFKRLGGSVEKSGHGIGLAICRRIALNHGGYVNVSSSLGQGAEFIVGLKLK
ncbi:MAG: ATP-binding protein [Sulfitobacter sp.]